MNRNLRLVLSCALIINILNCWATTFTIFNESDQNIRIKILLRDNMQEIKEIPAHGSQSFDTSVLRDVNEISWQEVTSNQYYNAKIFILSIWDKVKIYCYPNGRYTYDLGRSVAPAEKPKLGEGVASSYEGLLQ